ncbi:MAG: DUF3604 domain-containing protein [Cyanobium sp.]|nr:DUF3604 domain-containing protein [Cyanobium sp.]
MTLGLRRLLSPTPLPLQRVLHHAQPRPLLIAGGVLLGAGVVLPLLSAVLGGGTGASASAAAAAAVRQFPEKEAFFGETHVHTAYSFDAFLGGARLEPDGAYRFARGEEVEVSGQRFRLRRPLDWAAVTDHAEYLGEMETVLQPGSPGHNNPTVKELRGLTTMEEREGWYLNFQKANRSGKPEHLPFWQGPASTASAWRRSIDASERHNQPGVFSTLIGYEWTLAPGAANLHRNVFFRTSKVPPSVMSALDLNNEEKLWNWLASLEDQGMQVLAIPHNSNASKGRMFAELTAAGSPIDAGHARMRARFEPLIEMMQVKGNSEVVRSFWGNDEFAGFENADSIQQFGGRTFRKGDFVRAGVIRGLALQKGLGVNPFKYGFAGGTDTHNGTTGNTAEDNFMAGSHGAADGTVEARRTANVEGWMTARDINPGSLTGVWATSNRREAIWDGLKRKETFATSGTRLRVRVFAGTEFPVDLASRPDMVKQALSRGGVPMGADLPAPKAGRAPQLLVWARKDPDGANLDRIQIIKGWIDSKGQPQEKIFDVVWSGNRRPGADGKVPAVGNTVNLKTATYSNTIGAPVLAGLWRDPQFDPKHPALYYVRVLEIPTPRWSTYDAVRAGLPLLTDVPATVQERAWSSPIWFTPRG